MKTNSSIGEPYIFTKGDAGKVMSRSAHVFSGQKFLGSQEHFYFETQCTIAIPNEDNEWYIICASQAKSEAHQTAARLLGVPQGKITVRTKRLGELHTG